MILTRHFDSSVADQPAILCSWATKRSESIAVDGTTAPLPKVEVATGETAGVAARYNALSNALRSDKMPGQAQHSVSIVSCKATIEKPHTASKLTPWINASLSVCVDGVTFKLEISTEQSDLTASSVTTAKQSLRIMCHVPRLGKWVGFNVFSILSYFESLREAIGEGAEGKLKTIVAPMPCKVLSVLKKDGDKVQAGEKVIIVESMKMEISISAQVDGVFSTKVQEQDAVDEGTPLCIVE